MFRLGILSLAALGVVFGDIGTSPLYALRECFFGPHALPINDVNVLGILSLLIWALIVIISVKYMLFVLAADNRGEGGVLALVALIRKAQGQSHRWYFSALIMMGLFGSSLLYGDGIITPAISVLGAMEGMVVAAPHLHAWVLPGAVIVLVALFAVQRFGTERVGNFFGPIIALWFVVMALMGLPWIFKNPDVLEAFNPVYAWSFLRLNGMPGFVLLSSVFLVVTGGEAMYADMGHFGRFPIRLTWFGLAFPCLLLNYLGQGALILDVPASEVSDNFNPFFQMVSSYFVFPLVGLATLAAVIASQAVISGAYSLTSQAINLGYLPRMKVIHTSEQEIGQIYIPLINWALMLATIFLVVEFRSSSNLAAAYGISVSTTMVITTLLMYALSRYIWGWSRLKSLSLMSLFLVIDVMFFSSNILKVADGGWVPIVVGTGVFTLMTTWKKGRALLWERLRERSPSLNKFADHLKQHQGPVVEGTAIYMSGNSENPPPAFLKNLRHNGVLHERNILLTVVIEEFPHVPPKERLHVESISKDFFRVILNFGYMDSPNIPKELSALPRFGISFSLHESTFFLGRETLLATHREGMALWREHVFAFLSRNAQGATSFFGIPTDRVIEIGTQVEL